MVDWLKVIGFFVVGIAAWIAVFRFVIWTNETPKNRSSDQGPRTESESDGLPRGVSPPLNVTAGLANTVDILSKVSDLLTEGKREEAADFLKYAMSRAREFQLTPSNCRDLEMAYARILAGPDGEKQMLLLQISRAIRHGDIDIVGTLLASDKFRQLPDEDHNSALSELFRTAESASQDSIAKLIQSRRR